MRSHAFIRKHLYEYLKDDLESGLRARVDDHLRSCPDCSTELDRLRNVTTILSSAAFAASDERSADFWNTFSTRVEERIDSAQGRPRAAVHPMMESVHTVLSMRWRTAVAIGGAFALFATAFLLINRRPHESPDTAAVATVNPVHDAARLGKNVDGYFRKSQAVLIGLSNKRTEEGDDIDAERTVSRKLAREARLLRHQPLDPQSARLVGDLERIFITVANTDPREPGRDMEMVRIGIHSENLLFKVRMAQARYEPGSNQ